MIRVLKYYDLARKLFLKCDASGAGAGFTLLQNFSVDLEQDTDLSFAKTYVTGFMPPLAEGWLLMHWAYGSVQRQKHRFDVDIWNIYLTGPGYGP